MENLISVIQDYEIITEKQKAVITYDLSESKKLMEIENVFVIAKENANNNFDLIVSSDEGEDLIIFENLEENLLKKVINKKLFIAGINPLSNNLEQASVVSNVTIEKSNKLKKR